MPNWCLTDYILHGDEKDINLIRTTLSKLAQRKRPLIPNGFGKLWLGNIVTLLGKRWQEVSCRGEIVTVDDRIDPHILRLEVMSAWDEPNEVRSLLTERFPNISAYYLADEPGNGILKTNDAERQFFSQRYRPELFMEESGQKLWEDQTCIEDVASWIEDTLGFHPGKTESEIRSAMEKWEAEDGNHLFTLRKIDIEED